MDIAHRLIDFTDYHDLFAKYATVTSPLARAACVA